MGKASRNPTKKPYKVRIAEKQQEIDEEQAVSAARSRSMLSFSKFLQRRAPWELAGAAPFLSLWRARRSFQICVLRRRRTVSAGTS